MNNKTEEIFKECGAILKGHFVLAERKHGDTFFVKEKLYKNPVIFENMCQEMAHNISSKPIKIDVVAGPASNGVVIDRVACLLGEIYQKAVVPFFVEKDGTGRHAFKRSFDKDLAGKNVLVMDDIAITGELIRQLIKATILLKGKIAGVAVICDRGGIIPENLYGFPVISLMKLKAWWESDCPLCKAKVPIDADIGLGREFLKSHPGYPR